MYQPGKLTNAIMEMKRLNLDILGLSEVRWTGRDRIRSEGYEFIYSRGAEKHENGVGIILKKELSEMVNDIIPRSDRVIAVQINAKPKPITVIQVYAPTADSEEEEIE